ncbi:enoyl-CoA hydratase-related protein [Streptomyces humidus]|uniref:enoyl-CoA hydratase-related protein n=1 Tax=Streptomyces humidus TaxID=52259 RepID=UPI00331F3D96
MAPACRHDDEWLPARRSLAFDLRHASLKEAVFCQPEVAIGIVPGGGGSDRLARLLGRDRALEAVLTSEDYAAERVPDSRHAYPSSARP